MFRLETYNYVDIKSCTSALVQKILPRSWKLFKFACKLDKNAELTFNEAKLKLKTVENNFKMRKLQPFLALPILSCPLNATSEIQILNVVLRKEKM